MMYFDGGSDSISRKAIRGRWGVLATINWSLVEISRDAFGQLTSRNTLFLLIKHIFQPMVFLRTGGRFDLMF